jgi:hypothetical protein
LVQRKSIWKTHSIKAGAVANLCIAEGDLTRLSGFEGFKNKNTFNINDRS